MCRRGTVSQPPAPMIMAGDELKMCAFRLRVEDLDRHSEPAVAACSSGAKELQGVHPEAEDVHTILVVDDDPQVLAVVPAILRQPGYTVLTASDGYEATRVLADRHIDLLVTDIRMPGLSGTELATQAKVMRPTLRIIFITGFADAAGKVRGRVVQKPIRAADLIQTVKNEMAAA
jgi:CheY-like chemotaxis protein